MATDRPSLRQLYGSRTMLVLAALGFCGGLPNLLAVQIAPLWVSKAGWDVQLVGVLALMQLPYALKFFWAPMVDRVRIPVLCRLGQRRSWLLLSQLGACAGAIAAAVVGPTVGGGGALLAVIAAMVAFSATQDIVADAYRAQVLRRSELGAGAGVFVSGYRVAFVLVGALVLQLAEKIGWQWSVAAVGVLVGLGTLVTLAAVEPPEETEPRAGEHSELAAAIWQLVHGWGGRVVVLMLFVLLFRLPDQMGNIMTAPLLVKGLDYSTADIGWIRQGLGFGLTIVGALAGGWLVARLGLMRCLWAFGVLQAASNAGFWWLASHYGASVAAPPAPAPVAALVPVIAVESLAGGLVAAGFVAYLMSVCNVRHVATQFALLTGLMAAGGAVSGALSGVLAKKLDYPDFFMVTILAGIPGMAAIAWVRPPGSTSIAAPCPPR